MHKTMLEKITYRARCIIQKQRARKKSLFKCAFASAMYVRKNGNVYHDL